MIRRSLKMLFAAVAAVLMLGSLVEAAPKKAVRHRVRHSTRVASHTTAAPASALKKKATIAKKRRPKTSQRAAVAKRTPAAAKRRLTTKPR
jgi:hypothetical protein